MAGKGGKRPNAGRKRGSVNKLTALREAAPQIKEIKGSAAKAVTAAAILACVDEVKTWTRLLASRDENVKLKALCYLTDQRDGKAKQRVEASGPNGGPIEFANRTDAELLYFAAHGKWPDDDENDK